MTMIFRGLLLTESSSWQLPYVLVYRPKHFLGDRHMWLAYPWVKPRLVSRRWLNAIAGGGTISGQWKRSNMRYVMVNKQLLKCFVHNSHINYTHTGTISGQQLLPRQSMSQLPLPLPINVLLRQSMSQLSLPLPINVLVCTKTVNLSCNLSE